MSSREHAMSLERVRRRVTCVTDMVNIEFYLHDSDSDSTAYFESHDEFSLQWNAHGSE